MIESPLLDRVLAYKERMGIKKAIMWLLQSRFGPVPEDLAEKIRSVDDEEQLLSLIQVAANCADFEAFATHLSK